MPPWPHGPRTHSTVGLLQVSYSYRHAPTASVCVSVTDVCVTDVCMCMCVCVRDLVGDAYLVVSGHNGESDHALRCCMMATAMLEAVEQLGDRWTHEGNPLQIRIGMHTGPAHSGVLGTSRPRYTFFGKP